VELLHELIPAARVIGLVVNPTNPASAAPQERQVLSDAQSLGLEIHVLKASNEHDFDEVFPKLVELHATGLVISADTFFGSHSERLAALAARYAIAAIHTRRVFAVAGGLVSYGSDLSDSYRLVGVYTGRILKGEKIADLPVQQATKVELVINLKAAKALGSVPLPILGRADEVIEWGLLLPCMSPFMAEAAWKLKKSKRDENDILGFNLKIEWPCGVSAESGL
jgi:putative ABC transport system substrate-binding protein